MNHVLLVSGFLPSKRVPSGGQQLVYHEARELAKKTRLTLVAFCNEKEHAYHVPADFDFCHQVKVFAISPLHRIRAFLRHPNLPLVASTRYALAREWLRAEVRRTAYAQAYFEFIQVGALCADLGARVPTTLVVHDLFHEAIQRRADLSGGIKGRMLGWEAARTKRWEQAILRVPQHIATLTERDRDNISRLAERTDVRVRYPHKEVSATYRRNRETITANTILFFGQMSRDENIDAVRWFLREVFPKVLAEVPQGRLIVAGAHPPSEITNLRNERVEVLGFVQDVEPLFASAHLAIAPLRLGAGIKIKVVEYLAAGIPTVATSIGAEGIAPSPLLHIADQADHFAELCVQLLKS